MTQQMTAAQQAEYLHLCYSRVDGLWFLKVEEQLGFDAALELDVAVWQVLPKLQARALKRLLGLNDGREALRLALQEKLTLDGFAFTLADTADGLCLTVQACPWLALLQKSGREHVADRIGNAICTTEYGVFAREFGLRLQENSARLCGGGDACTFIFAPAERTTDA